MPTDDEIYALTDDHEFQTRPGWRRREHGSVVWEPACCYRRPYLYPHQEYCALPERMHRMRLVRGPVLVPRR